MQAVVADNEVGSSPPEARRTPRFKPIDCLAGAVAVVAILMCCRGEGHPFRWLLAALAIPAMRCVADAEYRRTLLARVRRLWVSLEFAASEGRTPWLAAFGIVTAPAFLLFLSNDRNADIGDTWPVIPAASSLTASGTAALDAYVGNAPASFALPANGNLPYCTVRCPGGIYSSYPSGMVPFAVPVAFTARLLGADLYAWKVQKHLEKWVASAVAALATGLFFLTALRLARPAPALMATLFLASGSVVFSTCSQNLWQHGGIIFWTMLALWVEFQPALRGRPAGVLLQGLSCGMMAACRLSSALVVIPFGLWMLCRAPRRAVALAVVSALVYAPWAWFYGSTYGNVFGPSTQQMAGGNWSWSVSNLWSVLASPSHGALVYQPWMVLTVGSLLPWYWRSAASGVREAPAGWGWFCLAVIGLQVVLVSNWRCWWGSHCWGSRLVAEAIPPAALLCVRPLAGLWARAGGRKLLAALAVCSFLMHAVAVYGGADYWHNRFDVDRHPEMLWSWSRAPFLYPFQR